MPHFQKRGNRIRASDNSPVFRFSAGSLLLLFLTVVLPPLPVCQGNAALSPRKVSKMILENGWYESETTQDSGFFKDLAATSKKEKITYLDIRR